MTEAAPVECSSSLLGVRPRVNRRAYAETFRILDLMSSPDRRHRPRRRQLILLATCLAHSNSLIEGLATPEGVVDVVMEIAGGIYLTRAGVERVWRWHRARYLEPPDAEH